MRARKSGGTSPAVSKWQAYEPRKFFSRQDEQAAFSAMSDNTLADDVRLDS
jgi:hypothetical protein